MSSNKKGGDLLLEDETLRDGLQMESRLFSLEEKIQLFQALKNAGVKRIQVGSFVNAKVVPQMADISELIRVIGPQEKTVVSALILNDKGLQRALDSEIAHVSMSVSVSDTHSRKNTRRSAAGALETMTQLIRHASASGLHIRSGLQCAFGCVFEGQISEDVVLSVSEKLIHAGAEEINLADTAGMATPYSVRHLIKRVKKEIPQVRISLHLHDTRGLGLANMFSGYESGVRTFDVCTGGLGGCPFVKGAVGNIPTEDAVHMFESMGIRTGIDLKSICDAVAVLEAALGRKLPGKMKQVLEHKGNGE